MFIFAPLFQILLSKQQMFSINIYLRFALIAVGIIGGSVLMYTSGFWYGFPFLLVGLILLAGYLMLGTIVSSNMLLGKMDVEGAEKRLALTLFPKLLLVGYKGIFFMTKAAIAMQRKDMGTAESLLKQALDSGLPSDNERGGAMMQLMAISAQKGNRAAVTNQLAEIKKLNITDPTLKEQLKEIEQQIKMAQNNPMNPSTLAMMGGRNGFRPGSKRPRPRMR
jgi:hypothetical protein